MTGRIEDELPRRVREFYRREYLLEMDKWKIGERFTKLPSEVAKIVGERWDVAPETVLLSFTPEPSSYTVPQDCEERPAVVIPMSDPRLDRMHRTGAVSSRIVVMDFADVEKRLLALLSDKEAAVDEVLKGSARIIVEEVIIKPLAAMIGADLPVEKMNVSGEHYMVNVRDIEVYATVCPDGNADALWSVNDCTRLLGLAKALTDEEWSDINAQIAHERELGED